MGRKKNKKSGKRVDSPQVLFVCGIGMVSLIAGFILWAIIASFFVPDVELGDPKIAKIEKQENLDRYQVIIPVKNKERKDVKISIKTEVGPIVYKPRQGGGMSVKAGFYKTLQCMGETSSEFLLSPSFDENLETVVEVKREKYAEFQVTEKMPIEPLVTIEKTSYSK